MKSKTKILWSSWMSLRSLKGLAWLQPSLFGRRAIIDVLRSATGILHPMLCPAMPQENSLRSPALLPIIFCHLLLGLDSVFPRREVHLLLLLFLGHSACILLAQSPPDGASLLGSEVEREVLLASIEFAESVALVGVDYGQAAGDRFAEVVT